MIRRVLFAIAFVTALGAAPRLCFADGLAADELGHHVRTIAKKTAERVVRFWRLIVEDRVPMTPLTWGYGCGASQVAITELADALMLLRGQNPPWLEKARSQLQSASLNLKEGAQPGEMTPARRDRIIEGCSAANDALRLVFDNLPE